MIDIFYDITKFCLLSLCMTIFAIGCIQVAVYFWQLIVAINVLFKNPNGNSKFIDINVYGGMVYPITIIIPAYNENVTIIASTISALTANYPEIEVIIVNDGSTDDTLDLLIAHFKLELIEITSSHKKEKRLSHQKIRNIYSSKQDNRLTVIDKVNGGKSDALNAGINFSHSPIVCLLDADSILDPAALSRAIIPFMDDPNMVAVGGTIRVANGSIVSEGQVREVRLSKNLLAKFQAIEYMRSFLMARVAWDHVNTLSTISGAFGLFKRTHVINAGGFTKGSVGEDFDLTVKLHKYSYDNEMKYNIKFVYDAFCWTQVPETLKVLSNQRIRWQAGALQTFRHFDRLFLSKKYKRLGFLLLPYVLIADIIGPIAEILGYFMLPLFFYFDILTFNSFVSYALLIFSFNVFVSSVAVFIDGVSLPGLNKKKYLLKLFMLSLIENFGYRQMCLWWKLKEIWRYLFGKNTWGKMDRVTFDHE